MGSITLEIPFGEHFASLKVHLFHTANFYTQNLESTQDLMYQSHVVLGTGTYGILES